MFINAHSLCLYQRNWENGEFVGSYFVKKPLKILFEYFKKLSLLFPMRKCMKSLICDQKDEWAGDRKSVV